MKLTYLWLLVSAVLLGACSNSMNQVQMSNYPQSTVGLTISNTQNSFFKAFYEAYEVEVKNQPSVTAFLNNANDNQDVQNQQIEEMISQGAKALVINLADVNQGGAIIGKYCNQVALVFFNRNPGDKALAKCQNAYFVDGDATQAGVLQGLKVLELWKENPDWDKNKDGKIQFAMLEGLVGHAGAQARTKWAISTMESYPELGIPVESVFHEHAMFNKEIAKETVSRWALSPAFGRVEIILANNDAMALGASGALSERQINLPIFGIDATSEALDAIKADRMTATVLNDATNQAKVALRLASNLAADVSPLNGIDYRMEYRVIQVPYQEVQ
ncbi:galactose ABC transporter substrate-binding protein [Moraxella sp. K1664]|uniref:galactose ABC transporter substrate-binding protein n=2 Tax=Moraxella TaxID=475 RepID=UPI00187F66CF|nr:galactose ABC transporter substrate-binding protein [Moraxella sp. K1664]MBE9578683.1 galactose ABC transporter substrate-binding protein [Moraxella sp. K1664]